MVMLERCFRSAAVRCLSDGWDGNVVQPCGSSGWWDDDHMRIRSSDRAFGRWLTVAIWRCSAPSRWCRACSATVCERGLRVPASWDPGGPAGLGVSTGPEVEVDDGGRARGQRAAHHRPPVAVDPADRHEVGADPVHGLRQVHRVGGTRTGRHHAGPDQLADRAVTRPCRSRPYGPRTIRSGPAICRARPPGRGRLAVVATGRRLRDAGHLDDPKLEFSRAAGPLARRRPSLSRGSYWCWCACSASALV